MAATDGTSELSVQALSCELLSTIGQTGGFSKDEVNPWSPNVVSLSARYCAHLLHLCWLVAILKHDQYLSASRNINARQSSFCDAAMQTYGPKGKQAMYQKFVVDPLKPQRLMMYRDELNSHLLKEMQRLQPAINLLLDTQVTLIDLDKQQVTFQQGNKPAEVNLALLYLYAASKLLVGCRSWSMSTITQPSTWSYQL